MTPNDDVLFEMKPGETQNNKPGQPTKPADPVIPGKPATTGVPLPADPAPASPTPGTTAPQPNPVPPTTTTPPPTTSQPPAQPGAYYHSVVKGDTLYNISKRYNTTVARLKELNNLPSDYIQICQTLRVQ